MDEILFWDLVENLGGDSADVDGFRSALARRSGAEILAFWDELVSRATVLNIDAYQEQTPIDEGDDPADPLPMSDDAFLDARLAVIALGRDTYESVVADPARFSAVWPFELGEAVVEAVGEAFELATGDPWPTAHPDRLPASDLPRLRRWRWFFVHVFEGPTRAERVPSAYKVHLDYLEHLLNEDQNWWRWWDSFRGQEAVLEVQIQPMPAATRRTTVRSGTDSVGYDEVTVAVRVPLAEFADPPAAPAAQLGWAFLARAHFDFAFAKLDGKLGLPTTPDLSGDTEMIERDRRRWVQQQGQLANQEARATDAWQRRRSSEHIWRGRAPDHAVAK